MKCLGKQRRSEKQIVESLTVVEYSAVNLPAIDRGAKTGRIIAESAILARDLVAQPPTSLPQPDR